jgi:hypothetical protein
MNEDSEAPSKVDGEPPLLFLSHRHRDNAIATVIREFIDTRTAGAIRVFQSSSATVDGPRIGRQLDKELVASLWEAGVVILLYTMPDHDWSWCMWECGVATHPRDDDTRTILFQCAGAAPPLFAGEVRVNLRDIVDVQKFTNELLTSPDFFPRIGRALTRFQPNSPAVIQAAQDLYERLKNVLPSVDVEPEQDWPPYPFIRLELSKEDVDSICSARAEERLKTTMGLVGSNALVTAADIEAERLFGIRGLSERTRLEKVVASWKERSPTPESKWYDALCSQIADAALNAFPSQIWELMRGAEARDRTWYAPSLIRVRRIPLRRCMEFDVYFCKFDVEEHGRVKVGVPPE